MNLTSKIFAKELYTRWPLPGQKPEAVGKNLWNNTDNKTQDLLKTGKFVGNCYHVTPQKEAVLTQAQKYNAFERRGMPIYYGNLTQALHFGFHQETIVQQGKVKFPESVIVEIAVDIDASSVDPTYHTAFVPGHQTVPILNIYDISGEYKQALEEELQNGKGAFALLIKTVKEAWEETKKQVAAYESSMNGNKVPSDPFDMHFDRA